MSVDDKNSNFLQFDCSFSKVCIFFFFLQITPIHFVLNCTCMGRFDTSGTSKNDNSPKVLVGHGVKKYDIKIFFRGLQAEIFLFVYIL